MLFKLKIQDFARLLSVRALSVLSRARSLAHLVARVLRRSAVAQVVDVTTDRHLLPRAGFNDFVESFLRLHYQHSVCR